MVGIFESTNLSEIDSTISSAENTVEALKAHKEVVSGMTEAKKLAVELHNGCRTPITTCGWFYEFNDSEHNWDGVKHKQYLDAATRILSVTTTNTENIVAILKIVKEVQ